MLTLRLLTFIWELKNFDVGEAFFSDSTIYKDQFVFSWSSVKSMYVYTKILTEKLSHFL